jgi:hypothetical protein
MGDFGALRPGAVPGSRLSPSLAAKESAEIGDEEEVLRQGIRLLKEVHKELDRGAGKGGA